MFNKVVFLRPFYHRPNLLTPFSIFFLKLDIKMVLVNTKENMSLVAKNSEACFKSGQTAPKKQKKIAVKVFFKLFFVFRER